MAEVPVVETETELIERFKKAPVEEQQEILRIILISAQNSLTINFVEEASAVEELAEAAAVKKAEADWLEEASAVELA